jgi:glyoxylase-like metal-dependent hydrolase (beta-lactamase superfamily II)
MTAPTSITITPVLVADLLAEGERMPVYVHVIDHPDARVLVDTGMTELHPAAADLDPRLRPLSQQNFDLAGIDIVVSTHLHFDHCAATTSSPAGRSMSSVDTRIGAEPLLQPGARTLLPASVSAIAGARAP